MAQSDVWGKEAVLGVCVCVKTFRIFIHNNTEARRGIIHAALVAEKPWILAVTKTKITHIKESAQSRLDPYIELSNNFSHQSKLCLH